MSAALVAPRIARRGSPEGGAFDIVLASARHEMLCARRERTASILLVVFVGMVSVSSIIGFVSNTTVTQVYDRILADGLTTAPNPFTNVSPLYYARNSVIYVVLIGALLAIVIGVQSTLRDRRATTTDLVLSRPLSTAARLAGQLLGLGALVAAVLAITTIISWALISVIDGGILGAAPTLALLGFGVLSWVVLMPFVALGMLSGIRSSRETTALLVPFVVWSAIAFVIPQIGTAARPVALLNPVPVPSPAGGYFDIVSAITSPFSITEQFKRAASIVLGDTTVTGTAVPSVLVLLGFVIVMTAVVIATPRPRLRRALDE